MRHDHIDKLFENNEVPFKERALQAFYFQYNNNPVYQQWCDLLVTAEDMQALHRLPFLPISFFKSKEIKTGVFEPGIIFESSGTTGIITSKHYVRSIEVYERSFLSAFRMFYGEPAGWCILGLLPSYLERKHSSLVYMMKVLMEKSGHPDNGFFLNDHDALHKKLLKVESAGEKTLLAGVSFALLDFAEKFSMQLDHTVIMETGGMKGRRQELLRAELHRQLKNAFGVQDIHSEYGMTELLSQAYAKQEGRFYCPPWMKVGVREEDDPLKIVFETSKPVQGAINVIDLTNIHSCCFIATEDVGRLYPDGSFEVLGRMDNSDVRGCSLMVAGES